MEFLQNITDSTNFPLLSAFILGIMTAISPCPLAMNITAVAYLSKDISNKRRVLFNGVFYVLGRMLSYSALATIIYFGVSKVRAAKWFAEINGTGIGVVLIAIGILMLGVIKFDIPFLSKWTAQLGNKKAKGSYTNAFFVGLLFALAFCPYSGVLYFGVLIPLTLSSSEGLLLPPIFSIATGLPVIILAFFLAYSMANVGKLYNNLKSVERWVRRFVAIVFIAVGVYYIIKS